MKNSLLLFGVIFFLLGGMSSCIVVEDDFDPLPPCEYNYTGQVCFENTTNLDMFIRTNGYNLDVWAFSSTCIELPAGFYDFDGRAGGFRWNGTFDVFVCEQSRVFLDYR